jgi:hypothetical protein
METKGRIYTREDVTRVLNNDIASCINRFGTYSYWTRRAIEYKESALRDYDAGKAVFVEKEEYHEDGMDFAILYYSDGSISHECYGYSD